MYRYRICSSCCDASKPWPVGGKKCMKAGRCPSGLKKLWLAPVQGCFMSQGRWPFALLVALSIVLPCHAFVSGRPGLYPRLSLPGKSSRSRTPACVRASSMSANKEEGKPGEGQSSKEGNKWTNEVSLESLRAAQAKFASDRNWDKHHTPRNIALALVGEVGELAEIFQWRRDEGCEPGLPKFSEEDKIHVGEEMSDVLLYLVRMADVCGVDLAHAVRDKLEKNAQKYPANLVNGSSKKYTEYSKQTGTLKRPRSESPPNE